jgi:uncharacterized Zn-binding protein involved in type VI secretion
LEGVAAEPIIIGSVYNGTESILPGSIFYLVYGSISSKTTAIGQTSGVPYVINGMNILQIAQPPSDTIAPTTRNMVISSVIYPTAPIGGIGVNVLGDNTYSGATVVLAGKGTVILGDSLVTVYPFDTIVPCVGN